MGTPDPVSSFLEVRLRLCTFITPPLEISVPAGPQADILCHSQGAKLALRVFLTSCDVQQNVHVLVHVAGSGVLEEMAGGKEWECTA